MFNILLLDIDFWCETSYKITYDYQVIIYIHIYIFNTKSHSLTIDVSR